MKELREDVFEFNVTNIVQLKEKPLAESEIYEDYYKKGKKKIGDLWTWFYKEYHEPHLRSKHKKQILKFQKALEEEQVRQSKENSAK